MYKALLSYSRSLSSQSNVDLSRMNELQAVAPELWICSRDFRDSGIEVGQRMTVVRVGVNSLWIHSPLPLSPELAADLAALGTVRHVLVPNCLQKPPLEEWRTHCRTALFWAAPGLRQISDFPFSGDLSEVPHPEWLGHFTPTLIQGMPTVNEVTYLHNGSRSLIVADLVYNLTTETDFASRLLARANGIHGHLAVSRLFRSRMKDKTAVAASLRSILSQEFDRLIPSHGSLLSGHGTRSLFAAAWSWLPDAFPSGPLADLDSTQNI